MGLFMSQFHFLLVVVAFLAVSCQQQQQITLPQDVSGSFGLHLNSYPQQSSASYSPSSSAAYTASGTRNWAAGQYPAASGQTDHYGYPSPEQLAQIPAPPLGQQQQQQSTSTYTSYPYATSASSSSAADWRGNQAADAWRSASQQQLVSHNNNLPYTQAQLNALYGAAAAQQQSKAYQQQQQQQLQQQQLYGSSADIYGQNQQQNYGRTQQQQYADSPYYSGQQSGANTGSMQQQRPAGPLNPQFQSAAGRIVFPGDQRAEHNGHSALWFNSAFALKVGPEHVLATLASLWLIIHAML